METVVRGGYHYLAKDGIIRVFSGQLRAIEAAREVDGTALAIKTSTTSYFIVRLPDATIFTDEQEGR